MLLAHGDVLAYDDLRTGASKVAPFDLTLPSGGAVIVSFVQKAAEVRQCAGLPGAKACQEEAAAVRMEQARAPRASDPAARGGDRPRRAELQRTPSR